ncbi:MAG: protease complex subunit PrcB family protein, partial [Flavobacteriaceae bacterium]|nr:protease complex subunit PrcB family protein [Flavobacteriaceae bacterium]
EAQIRVVKEQEGLNEIYNYLNKSRKPALNMPQVDFEKETIIALFMGQKNTGGFPIRIDTIDEKDDKLVVNVLEKTPEGKFATMVITQPFCIAKINKTDKEITFVKK